MRFIAALAFDMLYHARALNEGTGRLFGNREAKFVRKTLCPYLAGTRTPTFIELSTLWHMIKHTPDLPFKLNEPKSAIMPCMAIEHEGRLYLFKYFWSGLSATLWSRYCNSMKGYKVELFEFGNGDRLVYETVDIDYDNISFLKVLGFEVQTDYKRVTSLPQIDTKDLDRRLFPYQVKGVQMLQSGFRLMADEQGLGKTCQVLQFLKLNNPNKVLICCPATLKFNWKREILMWTNYKENEISILSGATPYRVTTRFSIINYDILPYWEKSLSESRYSFIVCDECFVAGTRVRVRGGYRNIEDLHVGDEVLSCSRDGVLEYKKVTAVKAQPKTMDFCTITDASGNNVTCTGNHRFFTSYTDTCEARSLQEGDYIISYNRTTHNEEVNDDRCATGVAWDLARRWLDTVSIQGCLESKACGEPLLEELRLCYEKIRALEGLVQEPVSERDSEHGMGRGTCAVYNKLLSAYEGISRAVLRWYEESDTSRGVESDERGGFSLLVYGRWLIQWYALLAQLRLYASGERDASEVVDGTLWSYSEDTVQQDEGLLLPVDACGEPCTVPAYDREVRGSVDDVQDCLSSKLYNEGMCGLWKAVSSSKEVSSDLFTRLFTYLCGESVDGVVQKTEIVEKHTEFTTRTVYDITVEDNHNFFAEDMLVHNCHYIQNDTAQRTRAFLSIAKSADDVIFISGTPFTSRPFQMYTALHTIAPKVFKSQRDYGERFCCPQVERGKTVYKGASNMDVLHSILMDGICIRRLKEDVLQELPSKRRLTVSVATDNAELRADRETFGQIRALERKIAESSDALGTLEWQKQIAYLRKRKAVNTWIEDFLSSGKKLVVFGTHTITLDDIMAKFGDVAVRVDGSTSQNKRNEAINAFQHDPNVKLFVGNMRAAGVGITLTAASDALIVEFPWTYSDCAQAEDRVHRIGAKDSVTIWYMCCPDSIDERLMEIINQKAGMHTHIFDGEEDNMMLQLRKDGGFLYHSVFADECEKIS